MKHLMSAKSFAAIAVALGAFVAASTARASSDVYVSIGFQVPGLYVQSVPVYVQPRPAYVYMPAPVQYGRFDEGRHFGGHHWQGRGPYGDLDRDGVVNRYDRDRDVDGVRNRYDRQPDNPYRR
jgi:hypothetical protein